MVKNIDLVFITLEEVNKFAEDVKNQEYEKKSESLIEIFKFFVNGKETLNKEDLKKILTEENEYDNHLTNEEFEEICEEINLTDENYIEIKKFVSIMLNK